MDPLIILSIAVGLAMDAFAVALATSIALRDVTPRQVFRFAFHFGLFQAMMPVLGWTLGIYVADYIQQWDHWVAFVLLLAVGVKAIREALKDEDEKQAQKNDPTRGLSLITYSIATSIDAMAVGLSFAMLNVQVWYPAVVIGLITAGLTTFGMVFGAKLGKRFGNRIEILGGIILIGIGLKILADHLLPL